MFTPELMRTLQDVGEPSSVPLFIIGMPRSGTTLIEQILASHPQVFGAGELPNLGNAVDSMRSTRGITISFREVMLNLSGEHLRRLGARYVSEITRLAPNVTYITDKMPSNFFFVGLIHLALPKARIIHVVRDPVDTCLSCFSTLFADGQYHAYDLSELGGITGPIKRSCSTGTAFCRPDVFLTCATRTSSPIWRAELGVSLLIVELDGARTASPSMRLTAGTHGEPGTGPPPHLQQLNQALARL